MVEDPWVEVQVKRARDRDAAYAAYNAAIAKAEDALDERLAQLDREWTEACADVRHQVHGKNYLTA